MKKYFAVLFLFCSSFSFAQQNYNIGGQPTNFSSGTGVTPIANGGTNQTNLNGLSLPNATLATPTVTVGAVTYTTSITLQASDNYKFVDMNAAGTVTVTVPSYSVVAFA